MTGAQQRRPLVMVQSYSKQNELVAYLGWGSKEGFQNTDQLDPEEQHSWPQVQGCCSRQPHQPVQGGFLNLQVRDMFMVACNRE